MDVEVGYSGLVITARCRLRAGMEMEMGMGIIRPLWLVQ